MNWAVGLSLLLTLDVRGWLWSATLVGCCSYDLVLMVMIRHLIPSLVVSMRDRSMRHADIDPSLAPWKFLPPKMVWRALVQWWNSVEHEQGDCLPPLAASLLCIALMQLPKHFDQGFFANVHPSDMTCIARANPQMVGQALAVICDSFDGRRFAWQLGADCQILLALESAEFAGLWSSVINPEAASRLPFEPNCLAVYIKHCDTDDYWLSQCAKDPRSAARLVRLGASRFIKI